MKKVIIFMGLSMAAVCGFGQTTIVSTTPSTTTNVTTVTPSGPDNIEIGPTAGTSTGGRCINIGDGAGISGGGDCVNIGYAAGYDGQHNINIGPVAGSSVTGDNNIYMGYKTCQAASGGNANVGIGQFASQSNIGDENVSIGSYAGAVNSSNNNTFIGAHADVASPGYTFATAIGSYSIADADNSIILGRTGGFGPIQDRIGMGISNPTAKLDIVRAVTNDEATPIGLSMINPDLSTDAIAGIAEGAYIEVSGANPSNLGVWSNVNSGTGENVAYFGTAYGGSSTLGGKFYAAQGTQNSAVIGLADAYNPHSFTYGTDASGSVFTGQNGSSSNTGVEANASSTNNTSLNTGLIGSAQNGNSNFGANIMAANGVALNYGVSTLASSSNITSTNKGVEGSAINGNYTYGGYFAASGGNTLTNGIYASNGVSSVGTGNAADCAGYFDGDVVAIGGAIYAGSDERLKTNVKVFENGLDLLKMLKTKTYDFKVSDYKNSMNLPTTNQIGIMAQNMKSVFPNLVKEKIAPAYVDPKTHKPVGADTKFLAVNYTGLIPVLVSAVNELDAKTEENAKLKTALDNTLSALDKTNAEVAALKQQLNDICSTGCAGLRCNNATDVQPANQLMQNVPNPWSQETTIGYVVNTGTTAYMNINALDGKLIRHIDLAKGAGSVTIGSNELSAGTYTYSLYVDANVIDTKLMVISAEK